MKKLFDNWRKLVEGDVIPVDIIEQMEELKK